MMRLIASESRINSEKLRSGMLKTADFKSLTDAAGRIYDAPLYIDDTPNMKLLDLRAQARRMKSKEKVQVIFIDYIGLIEPESKINVPRHEQVAEISRSLKSLARELGIPIICLSQVGRQSEEKLRIWQTFVNLVLLSRMRMWLCSCIEKEKLTGIWIKAAK